MHSCDHCKYSGVKVQADKTLVKVCRRHPPHVSTHPIPQQGRIAMMTMMAWPSVEDDDWCGEYARKVALA